MSAEVKSVSIDVRKEEVLVESALTSAEVQALIESTGRRAVLKGIGASQQGERPRTRRSKSTKQICQIDGLVYLNIVYCSVVK